jgi:omega-hydroxy-beta-dihydromenaquinone-9 sulfotransferase
MVKIYYRILVSAYKTFGFSIVFGRWLLLLPVLFLFTPFTLFLDRIFFSNCFKLPVKAPIFIIGNPRSGTTFLHNLLTQTEDFVAFKTWHIIFPSLTARVFLRPIINYLIRNNRTSIVPEHVGHRVILDGIEEEELLFFHKLDTQFVLQLSPLLFDNQDYPELRFHDKQPDARRKSSVTFFKRCLQRQIYYTGRKRVVAQIHYSIHRLKTLKETFPDAKFVYLVRSPLKVIPSHLSLTQNMLAHEWDFNKIPQDKLKQCLQRRYRYDIELYHYFYDLCKSQEVDESYVLILLHKELLSDLYKSFKKIASFIQIEPSTQLLKAVEQQAYDQKKYKRKHKVMKLEEFSLTKECIIEDLSFIFEEYGFDRNLNQETTS